MKRKMKNSLTTIDYRLVINLNNSEYLLAESIITPNGKYMVLCKKIILWDIDSAKRTIRLKREYYY